MNYTHLASPQVIKADHFIKVDHTSFILLKRKELSKSCCEFDLCSYRPLQIETNSCPLPSSSYIQIFCVTPYLYPSNESFWQKQWHLYSEILLSCWSQRKYSSSFRTHSHSTHAGTVRNTKWHPSALKKIILALNTQFFFSPCSGSEFLQDFPGKSDFQLIKFTAHPRQTILPHSLGRHTSVLSLGQHLQTSGESPVSCTMTDTEIHYSIYLNLVVIQRTGFGFQKRKPIYRREA